MGRDNVSTGLLFRLMRWLVFLLHGRGKKEKERYLFKLAAPLDGLAIFERLARHGWQPYASGYVYRYQIYQVRRLVSGRHQYHVRFYRRGSRCWTTGHFETTPEWSAREHLAGKDLRNMRFHEVASLIMELEII